MAVLAPSQPLTERSATDLARAIRHRETSSRDVVEAHIERIEYMHERINAVVADRFDAARADADYRRHRPVSDDPHRDRRADAHDRADREPRRGPPTDPL